MPACQYALVSALTSRLPPSPVFDDAALATCSKASFLVWHCASEWHKCYIFLPLSVYTLSLYSSFRPSRVWVCHGESPEGCLTLITHLHCPVATWKLHMNLCLHIWLRVTFCNAETRRRATGWLLLPVPVCACNSIRRRHWASGLGPVRVQVRVSPAKTDSEMVGFDIGEQGTQQRHRQLLWCVNMCLLYP